MQLNQSTDYAIRMILYLAKVSHTIPSSKLSRAIGISPRYLLQIGAKLRDAGLVAVTYGVAGGYKISKHPAEISLLDIICLMEHKPCFPQPSSVQSKSFSHALDAAYRHISKMLADTLQGMTIQSLLSESNEWQGADFPFQKSFTMP